MKKFIFAAIILLSLSFGQVLGQMALADSLNMAEREYFYRKYRSVRDTMKINTWINLKRVSDNLEQVVKRDQQVIDAMKLKISADSVVIAGLNEVNVRYQELQIGFDDLKTKAEKDSTLNHYLKIAGVSLLMLFILFLSLFINSVSRLKRYRSELDQGTVTLEEHQLQIDSLDAELRKLKQREADFREELEKGMESNQVRLLSIQQKCELLEKENQQLRKVSEVGEGIQIPVSGDPVSKTELSDNADDLKQMVKSLMDERNSLINLAGKLRVQADNENKKNQEIIKRINLLVNDLSTGNGG
ncbi:MAG: hypothetical protein FD166_2874 [Bacteroidetes bacterium]|nr:MAG: hypothetical protein FD166_2874 [Bacteroidota bacterium]